MKQILKNHRGRLVFIALLLALVAAFHLFKSNSALMSRFVDDVTGPFKRGLAYLCSFVPFSVAEAEMILFSLFVLVFITTFILRVAFERSRRAELAFKGASFLVSLGLLMYVLMCALWGCNYYADGFAKRSGLETRSYSTDELYRTTKLFAEKLADVAFLIPRNENGEAVFSVAYVIEKEPEVFNALESQYPFLGGASLKVKPVFFSEFMSFTGTTGVTFPFTGETNINVASPRCFIPVTAVHETAHQRNVASEQEANFVAVLACDKSDDAVFRYSGYLLAYVNLSNALYGESPVLWEQLRETLPTGARIDLYRNNLYWKRYEGKVSDKSDELYDSFLKGYDQPLGTKSYGAVVDLLIEYYLVRGGE